MKKINECSIKELEEIYDALSIVEGEDRKSRQELQKRRFRELILPLGHEGNTEQKSWARSKLIEEGHDFIHFFIDKYYRSYRPRYGKDLENEGLLWLCQYGFNYNPDKASFTTFLTLNLKGVMHKYINSQVNNVSAHYGARMDTVRKAQSQLEKEMSDYTIEDLAARTGYPVSVIKTTLELIQCNNKMYFDGDDQGFLNAVPSKTESPEEMVIKQETRDALLQALKNLPKKYRDVLGARFIPESYFPDQHDNTISRPPGFEAIAKLLGMTPAQVRGYYRRAIMRLRHDPGLIEISDASRRHNDNANRDFRVICLNDKESIPDDSFDHRDQDGKVKSIEYHD